MKNLRLLHRINAVVLLTGGFVLYALNNSQIERDLLGLPTPGTYHEHLPEWRALGFTGEFAGALIAFGFATLAIAYAKDERILRSAIPYLLAGHFFLSFMVWGKTMAFGATPGGLALTAVVIYPGAGLFYALFSGFSHLWTTTPSVPEDERTIREAAGQAERTRLAQDLHDSVKQQVYAIQTNLAAAQARWESDGNGAREAVDRARSTAQDAMTEMTALLDRLRRDPIESVGFIEAFRRQGEALGFQSGAEVKTRFGDMPENKQLPNGAMTALFRIGQEAFANVARHARAQHVELRAGIDSELNVFTMVIEDDGQGFDRGSAVGMGLANIQDRAREIGASADIVSSPGEGCRVLLSVPLVDPRQDRIWRHQVSVAVSILILLSAAFLNWVEGRAYLLPLVILAGAFALAHTVLGVYQWRAR